MRHIIFGESHGPAIGVVLEQVPAGIVLDEQEIAWEMGPARTGEKSSFHSTKGTRCSAHSLRCVPR